MTPEQSSKVARIKKKKYGIIIWKNGITIRQADYRIQCLQIADGAMWKLTFQKVRPDMFTEFEKARFDIVREFFGFTFTQAEICITHEGLGKIIAGLMEWNFVIHGNEKLL